MVKKNRQKNPRNDRTDVRMSSHSLAKITKSPFPREWRTKVTWTPPCSWIAPGSASGAFVVRLNDIYDPDYSNSLGNGQPLYTDQMMSATGPYQCFRVDGWKATVNLCNVSPTTAGGSPMPLDVYIMQGATNATDVDTFSELAALPGVETDLLGPSLTVLCQKEWSFNGRTRDYIPKITSEDDSYSGAYNASPSKLLYMGVGYKNGDPTDATAVKLFAKVVIEYDVVFYARDAVVS
jgi:hypothetical protein